MNIMIVTMDNLQVASQRTGESVEELRLKVLDAKSKNMEHVVTWKDRV